MQPLVPLVFHNLPSLYPPSFRRNDFLYLYIYNWRDIYGGRLLLLAHSIVLRNISPLALQIDLMDHPLYTISYVADIENVLVVMINRVLPPVPGDRPSQGEVEEGGGSGGGGEGEGVREVGEKGEGVRCEGVEERGNSDEVEEAGNRKGGEGAGREKEGGQGEGGEKEGGQGEGGQGEGGEGGQGEGGEKEGGQGEGGQGEGGQGEGGEKEGEGGEKEGGQGEGGEVKEEEEYNGVGPLPRMTCHVLETNDVSCVHMDKSPLIICTPHTCYSMIITPMCVCRGMHRKSLSNTQ